MFRLIATLSLFLIKYFNFSLPCVFIISILYVRHFNFKCLVIVRLFEKNILVSSTKNTKRLKMSISCTNEHSNAIYDYIIENSKYLREISKKLNKSDENLTKINVILDFVGRNPIQSLYKDYQKLEGIESISIHEVVD